MKRGFRKIIRVIGQVVLIGAITLALFELCFRIYLIDFYKSTFDILNENLAERTSAGELVIVGDSFSAFKDGYAQVLHDSLPDFNVRNISVQGTSIREQFLFGRHYIKRKKPEILIFQFYVGNDLFGWRHPVNWEDISLARNLYWQASHHVWSLTYLNSKLAYLKGRIAEPNPDDPGETVFSPESYSKRDVIYFETEPALIENSAYLKAGRANDLDEYLERMKKLFKYASPMTDIYLLVIPHGAQVADIYRDRMKRLGAEFTDDFQVGQESYPLIKTMTRHFSKDDRIRVLNPISFFRQQELQGIRTYYAHDSHLSHEGQVLLGHYLIKELEVSLDIRNE